MLILIDEDVAAPAGSSGLSWAPKARTSAVAIFEALGSTTSTLEPTSLEAVVVELRNSLGKAAILEVPELGDYVGA